MWSNSLPTNNTLLEVPHEEDLDATSGVLRRNGCSSMWSIVGSDSRGGCCHSIPHMDVVRGGVEVLNNSNHHAKQEI
jgi:hypothetical protein